MKKYKKKYEIDDICKIMLNDYNAVMKKLDLFYIGKLNKGFMLQTQLYFENNKKFWIKRYFINIMNAFGIIMSKNKKFIFVGLRYKQLLNGLKSDEVLIIARSKSDVIYALRNRIAFILVHNIVYFFYKAYFENNTKSLESEMYRFYRLFSLQKEICYLILTSDTHPQDMFFSSLANQFNSVFRVLCIQHGMYADFVVNDDLVVRAGERTPFNVLYNETSKKYYSKYIKNSEFFIMGPPWDIPHVRDEGIRDVVLVGTDEGSPFSDIFQELSNLLKKNKINHTYRPHPSDTNVLPDGLLQCIDTRSKDDLLSGAPKIFIGFISTLLYEAYICGHTVFSIVYHRHFAKTNFDVDAAFYAEELPFLCSTIARQTVVRKRYRNQDNLLPLSKRFINVINDIEFIVAKKQNG
ncbi:MAG: hypothetical protein HQL10_06110 [Nitrospirae bacterium]|nr:hypothetical protein [Nitrospirota bacterium]